MLSRLDDPIYVPASTAQQRADTIKRGAHLRRRRVAAQVSVSVALVAAIVSVLAITAPSILRASPDRVEPLTPTPTSPDSAWLPVGTGIVASGPGSTGYGEVLIGTTTEDGIETNHQIVRADIPGCTKGLFDCKIVSPAVSADGKSVAFEVVSENSPNGLWVADVDGDGLTHVLSQDAGAPAWSPDGRELAVVIGGDGPHTLALVAVDLESGHMRTIVELAVRPNAEGDGLRYGGFLRDPTWSSDGDTLAFVIDYWGEGSVIAVAPSDGSKRDAPKILTEPSLFAWQPDWSPIQDLILFSQYNVFGAVYDSCLYMCLRSLADKPQNLYTIHPDGANLQRLTDLHAGDGAATQATWTADGQRVVFVRWPLKPGSTERMVRQAALAVIDAAGTMLDVPPLPFLRSAQVLPTG